jgi:hypothetical protein
MLPELSIVKVDKRHYRTIARENWGLTKEQMRGKHVHHRLSISEGGTDDPSNLYVCSPSFHRWGWHNGEEWIEWASEGGKTGGTRAAELGIGAHAPGMASKGGRKTAELGVGVHAPGMASKGGTKGGRKAAELSVGIHGRTSEQMTEDGRKGGAKSAELGVGIHSPGKQSEGGTRAAELGVGAHAPGMASKGGKVTGNLPWWYNPCTGERKRSEQSPGEGWERRKGPNKRG